MLMIMAMMKLSVSYQDWGLSLFLSHSEALPSNLGPEDWHCQRTGICFSLREEGDEWAEVKPGE